MVSVICVVYYVYVCVVVVQNMIAVWSHSVAISPIQQQKNAVLEMLLSSE